jgi:hypothetical protein
MNDGKPYEKATKKKKREERFRPRRESELVRDRSLQAVLREEVLNTPLLEKDSVIDAPALAAEHTGKTDFQGFAC